MVASWLVPVLVACTSQAPSDTATPDVTPWQQDGPETGPMPLGLDQVQASFEELVPRLLTLDSSAYFSLYEALMGLGDEACPYREEAADISGDALATYWAGDGCTAASGARFDGYTYGNEYDHYEDEDGWIWTGQDLKGEPVIVDAQGRRFRSGGIAYHSTGYLPSTGDHAARTGIQGDVLWEGEVEEEAWFLQELRGDLELMAWWLDDHPAAWLHGAISGFGGPVDAIQVQGFGAVAPELGADCPGEPGGLVQLRTDSGWITIAFAGASAPPGAGEQRELELVETGDACDGCGQVWWDGQAVGEICPGTDLLLDWEDRPW